ncbi:MAG: methionine biosynthesis protein MetW [Acidobacteria bacterium]|nr:MAG: methionine biosynthesis protein MetW [Acidobacteriota bacterium]
MPDQLENRSAIYEWILKRTASRGRVLDVGCGDGELLSRLAEHRGVEATGIELSQECVIRAVQRGLSVHHGNAEEGLCNYPDGAFDLVILSLAVQELEHPRNVLRECLRVGRRVLVVFPAFGHWRARWQLAFLGRSPVTPSFPHAWHDSPNRHYLTVKDWEQFCNDEGWKVLEKGFLTGGSTFRLLPNLRAEVALYLLET